MAALVTGVITVPIAAAGLLATRRHTRALLLAVAAGLADTCAAVVTMAFMHSLAHGLGATVTSWPPYALIVAGLASLTLAQTAYQTDAPLITLPTITAVMPLASLAVGIVALHETAHLNAVRIVIMTACLAVAVTALAGLARAAAAVAEANKQPDDDHRSAERTEHPVANSYAEFRRRVPASAVGIEGRCDRFIVEWTGSKGDSSCAATKGGSQSSLGRVQVTARQ